MYVTGTFRGDPLVACLVWPHETECALGIGPHLSSLGGSLCGQQLSGDGPSRGMGTDPV